MIDIIYVQNNMMHPLDFQYIVDRTNDFWLLTMSQTPAYYIAQGKRIVMPAHTVVLYPPYSSIEYGSIEGEGFGDDWIRFYTDEPFICNGAVPLAEPFKALHHFYISDLIRMISIENFFKNEFKEFTIRQLFQILFSKLKESLTNSKQDFRQLTLQKLHSNIIDNPASPWNVSDMAKLMYVSPRHLQKLYRDHYGISCMDDVIQHRLMLAKEKLSTTMLPIYKVAEQCGYSNTEHFSRQFKKNFGISPKAYRKNKTSNGIKSS